MLDLSIIKEIPELLEGIVRLRDLKAKESEIIASKNKQNAIYRTVMNKFIQNEDKNHADAYFFRAVKKNQFSMNIFKNYSIEDIEKLYYNVDEGSFRMGNNNLELAEKVTHDLWAFSSGSKTGKLSTFLQYCNFQDCTEKELLVIRKNLQKMYIDYGRYDHRLYKLSAKNPIYRKKMLSRKSFSVIKYLDGNVCKMHMTKEFWKLVELMDSIIDLSYDYEDSDFYENSRFLEKFIAMMINNSPERILENKELKYAKLSKILNVIKEGIQYTKTAIDESSIDSSDRQVVLMNHMRTIFDLFLELSKYDNWTSIFDEYFKEDYLDILLKDNSDEIYNRMRKVRCRYQLKRLSRFINNEKSKDIVLGILETSFVCQTFESISVADAIEEILKYTYGKKIQDRILNIIDRNSQALIDAVFQNYKNLNSIMDLNVIPDYQLENLLIEDEFIALLAADYKGMNIKTNYEEIYNVVQCVKEYPGNVKFFNCKNKEIALLLDTIALNKNTKPHNRLIRVKELFYILNSFQEYMGKGTFKTFINQDSGYKAIMKFLKKKGNMNLNQYLNIRKGHQEQEIYIAKAVFDTYVEQETTFEEFKETFAKTKLVFFVDNRDADFLDLYKSYLDGTGHEAINEIIENSAIFKELIENLEVDNEFVSKHFEQCVDFCLSSNFKIFQSYIHNSNTTVKVRNNFRLITIALILGKYDELKYNYEDLQKEVGMDIDYNTYLSWKTDNSFDYDSITVKDAGDYNTIMTIGSVPTRTCMNYESGMYSQCLISNFDTCKKILKVYDRGVYAGRAILRLTVLSDKKIKESQEISFKNFYLEESKATDSQNDKDKEKKELVVFVEKLYTNNRGSVYKYQDSILKFLREKSHLMNVRIIMSNMYGLSPDKMDIGYVQINKSKNSSQYMDSFHGESTQVDKLTSCKTKYFDVNNF